ncbi:MAG TPA: hypothetical protein VLH10_28500 [Yinghuangia sp.]|uniref:hypothetical protein n=1 Tax=Yinghuangia sp. YIM S10712 TaxID=3436930 RepID=UPI002CA0B944|nr:hypothetical protein [Yinghuangia sp.]
MTTTRMRTLRNAAAITVGAALLATVGAAAPALAAGASPPGAGVVRAERVDVVHRVTAFWDQYKSAVLGTNPYMNPEEVRGEFLTAELNAELDAWAAENGADPVFRAQNVPLDRTVRYEGSGAGHASVVVTQYWGDGSSNDVWYRVPLDGSRIDGLQDPPV